ncbi:MAG: hypothetical protein ACLSD6_04510 [Clostridium sp.]
MNCKVQKYRVLVMGLLILSLMGLLAADRNRQRTCQNSKTRSALMWIRQK